MPMHALAFLLGVLLLQCYTILPSIRFVWIILLFLLALKLIFNGKTKNIYYLFFQFFLIGFGWCLWYAHQEMKHELPNQFENQKITISGNIFSIPACNENNCTFLFLTEKILNFPENHLIKLSWIKPETKLNVGDQWLLNVKLKRIHGLRNPAGFDYEAWSFQSGINAQGYILNKEEQVKLNNHWFSSPINRIRQFLKDKIERSLPKSNTSPWISALVVGERSSVSQSSWEVLRNTGTNHLMAIGGLHIGFLSAFIYQITFLILRKINISNLLMPAQHVAVLASLFVALIYSALSGFSIPAERTFFMIFYFSMVFLLRRKGDPWQTLGIALFLMLLLNPLNVLSQSFWLSLGAVFLIIFGMNGRLISSRWWKWNKIQWVLAIGLLPLTIGLFQEFSFVSFIANCIAIPCIGLLIVPLCFIGISCFLISTKLASFILTTADHLLGLLWLVLNYLSHLSWATWHISISYFTLIEICIGVLLILLPSGFPGKYLGLIWLLPLFFQKILTPMLGEVWLTLLDVGQGLSVVIQTQKHLLVYDTGSKMGESYDMGESVVSPFLYSINTKKIDMLVVSHGDNDHIGGSGALLKRFFINSIKSSVPEKFSPYKAELCLTGQAWEWDKVKFEFLYPSLDDLNLGNDSSCVLRVSAGNNHILLPGDAEKFAEKQLMITNKGLLNAQILIAPHHGSKTSSWDDFINAVHPAYVLYGVGYLNRYHLPNKNVIEKYNAINAIQFDTAQFGAIQMKISPEKIYSIVLMRKAYHHYWN